MRRSPLTFVCKICATSSITETEKLAEIFKKGYECKTEACHQYGTASSTHFYTSSDRFKASSSVEAASKKTAFFDITDDKQRKHCTADHTLSKGARDSFCNHT